jgi:hypothetical protein
MPDLDLIKQEEQGSATNAADFYEEVWAIRAGGERTTATAVA